MELKALSRVWPPRLALKINPLALGLFLGFISGALAQPGTPVWSFPTTESILSSPAVASDGTLYIGSYDRKVYSFTPEGTKRWEFPLPPPVYIYFDVYAGVYGTSAIGPDGTVYVPSENGNLLALNSTNGAQKWVYSLNGQDALYSSPAIGVNGTIYFGGYDKNFYAINPDGTKKWNVHFGDSIFASPVVGADGTIYCGCDDGKLYALEPANGSKKWTFTTGSYAITAAPAIAADGTIYIGVGSAHNPKFYSISPAGATNWSFTTGSRIRSSPALGTDGTIYFGCDDDRLYALNPNGTKKWEFVAGGAVGSSPALAADGAIYFGCDDGLIYGLDAMGQKLWTFATTNNVFASPAIGQDGTVYIASADGNLYALSGGQPPANSSWPMFRYDGSRVARAPGTAPSSNHPPVLSSIFSQAIVEGGTLVFTNSANDPDQPSQQLTFTLDPAAPMGASIDSTSGVFTWTPTEDQGPGAYVITVRVTDNGAPPLSDIKDFTVAVMETNSPPLLVAIGDRTLVEDSTLSITNLASDLDIPANQLTFSLDPGAPIGAIIDGSTGIFTWTPTEDEGPGSYFITVRVTDNGSPPLTDAKGFTVTVTETNAAPVLAAILDYTIVEGTTLLVTNSATDPDIPPNHLTFSLASDAPVGASINAESGVFSWTPTGSLGVGTHYITVQVADDGWPILSDMKTFAIIVVSRPRLESITISDGAVTLAWSALAGQTYRVQYKTNLEELTWNDLPGDVTATSAVASKSDTLGPSDEQRFYRIELIP
jgi:outer membrane protein assembly factor BamB